MLRFAVLAGVVGLLAAVTVPNYHLEKPMTPEEEKAPKFWNDMALKAIKHRLNMKNNENQAKNVILFIGDGMGPSSVTGGRILRGQTQGKPGEETVLNWETFPNVAISKTYNVDRQTPDSAGTGTAIMSGVKASYFQIGLNGNVTTGDCIGQQGNEVTTILDWSLARNKKVGIVTTARITHATPGAAYAHAADRYWEGQVDVSQEVLNMGCKDIARQLVEDNSNITVLFGGGRRSFMLKSQSDPETGDNNKHREDGRDLIKMWQDDKEAKGASYKYAWDKDGFDEINPRYHDYALGLFEPNHMQYDIDRDKAKEPSLADMTRKAIQLLTKNNDDGFFLLVEGARIDHGHHDSLPLKALYDVLSFEDAVQVGMDMTSEEDTLLVVTADHATPMSINGYSYRGSDLFGYVTPVASDELTEDGKPYSVINYANGPGYKTPREDNTLEQLHNRDFTYPSTLPVIGRYITGDDNKDFTYPSALPVPWTTHSGEDVFIYARGPMAHLFHGVQEENYIGHVMAYASCVGRYTGDCTRSDEHYSSAAVVQIPTAWLIGALLLSYIFLK